MGGVPRAWNYEETGIDLFPKAMIPRRFLGKPLLPQGGNLLTNKPFSKTDSKRARNITKYGGDG